MRRTTVSLEEEDGWGLLTIIMNNGWLMPRKGGRSVTQNPHKNMLSDTRGIIRLSVLSIKLPLRRAVLCILIINSSRALVAGFVCRNSVRSWMSTDRSSSGAIMTDAPHFYVRRDKRARPRVIHAHHTNDPTTMTLRDN